jgi:hypothetical protein
MEVGFYHDVCCSADISLVRRQKGKYSVTAFGRMIYDAQKLLGRAPKNYWKLNATDSLGVTQEGGIPKAERILILHDDFFGKASLLSAFLLTLIFSANDLR